MAFSNEFASEEDTEKFDLNGLWDVFYPERAGRPYELSQPSFTIDRERNVFYMAIRQGREELSNRRDSILWIDGKLVRIQTDSINELAQNPKGFNSDPYRITWELVEISAHNGIKQSYKEILRLLKEALAAYGAMGVHQQVKNTVVEFKF